MANLNFPPATPGVPGPEYTFNGIVYYWDGEKWTANNEDGFTEVFVNVDGDTMTGPLLMGNSNPDLANVTIDLRQDMGDGAGVTVKGYEVDGTTPNSTAYIDNTGRIVSHADTSELFLTDSSAGGTYLQANANGLSVMGQISGANPTGSGTINLRADGSAEFTGDVQMASQNGGPLAGFRNMIINGAMEVAQRGIEFEDFASTGFRTVDRFGCFALDVGVYTMQQSTDAPPGFSKSFKCICTTANSSSATNRRLNYTTSLEGYDCQRIFRTATTTYPLTLSFWVKSSKAGNASIGLFQSQNALRMFYTSYNIAAANTWGKNSNFNSSR